MDILAIRFTLGGHRIARLVHDRLLGGTGDWDVLVAGRSLAPTLSQSHLRERKDGEPTASATSVHQRIYASFPAAPYEDLGGGTGLSVRGPHPFPPVSRCPGALPPGVPGASPRWGRFPHSLVGTGTTFSHSVTILAQAAQSVTIASPMARPWSPVLFCAARFFSGAH